MIIIWGISLTIRTHSRAILILCILKIKKTGNLKIMIFEKYITFHE